MNGVCDFCTYNTWQVDSGGMYEYKSWVQLVSSIDHMHFYTIIYTHIRKWKKKIHLLADKTSSTHKRTHTLCNTLHTAICCICRYSKDIQLHAWTHSQTHTQTDLKEIHSTSVDLRVLLIRQRNCLSGRVLWSGHVYTCLHATTKVSAKGKCVSHSLTRPGWPALSEDSTDRRQVRANSSH